MTRPRLAYFSPLPPARTGIADYSRELLPYLAMHASITLFTEDPAAVDPGLLDTFPVLPLADYPERRFHYDLPLYHIGNNLAHAAIYHTMRRYPGLLVLHDYRIHDLVASVSAGVGDTTAFMHELGYANGRFAVNQLRDLMLQQIEIAVPPEAIARHIYLEGLPLCERSVTLNLGTIVHSRYVQQRVQSRVPDRPVEVIPLMVQERPATPQRHRLPWPRDAVIFASAGYITPARGLDAILRVFAQLRQEVPKARLLIVGGMLREVDLPGMIAQWQLQDVVHYAGYAPDVPALLDWMATADVLINLRRPTMGETSATVLRAMAMAKPVIVDDHGWYAELPDDACYKVPPGDDEALLAAMRQLAGSPEQRQQIGRQGQQLVRQEHEPGRVAARYFDFIQRLIGR